MDTKDKKKLHGLSGKTQKAVRKHMYDQDYIAKLSLEEKQWLDRFNREWNQADFSKPGKDLHRTKKEKKIVYDKNNANNRCQYSRSKARNVLYSLEDQNKTDTHSPEDDLIDKIDNEESNDE